MFKLLTNAYRNLPLYLNSDDEKRQIVGTTWLLSILGFMHINLGIINSDDERLKDGNSTKGTVDTIAFNKNIGILAIDLTTSPPKEDKIDKIRNSARYINEQLMTLVTPMIICNKECPDTKTSVYDVVVIDRDDTDKLIDLISNNKIEEARQSLYSRVKH